MVEGNESGEEATQSMKKKGKHTAILPEDFQPYDYSSKTFSEVATQGTNKMYFDPRKTDVNLRKNKVQCIGVGMTCTLGGGGGSHSISCAVHVQYNSLFYI